MYGNEILTTVHNGRYGTWPVSINPTYTRTVFLYQRRDYTYGNEPSRETLRRQLDEFKRLTETTLEQKQRISRERNRRHIRSAKLFAPPPLVETMFSKPTFVRRACGGRWRVRTP
jgi:hypothetical protein